MIVDERWRRTMVVGVRDVEEKKDKEKGRENDDDQRMVISGVKLQVGGVVASDRWCGEVPGMKE